MKQRITSVAQDVAGAVPGNFDVTTTRPSGGAPVTVVNRIEFRNDGVIGSQLELENWLAKVLDNLGRTGRLPTALRAA
jgi:hypothetical protein